MRNGPNTRWEEQNVGTPSFQPHRHGVSVMRDFLDSEAEFEWPEKFGKCSGKHCDIDVGKIPLIWKKLISNKSHASIDMYEAGPDFRFQKLFVVKQIRGVDNQEAWTKTAKEVENMKDLRHPHVTALLATFTYQARLSIVIFPAACCDLHQFMERISIDLEKVQAVSPSDVTRTIDSERTDSSHLRDSNVRYASKHKEHEPQEVPDEPWPLTIPMDMKIEMLRGYFVCLSQALSYLHASDVRHKDIKPANILIDESGSVILTDFGISRRFPKHTPHATNNEWKFTRKYASPEIMKDKDALRDDSSDVFSLGCVFLEMATLLLGKSLTDLSKHYATIINDSSKEEAYHYNLGSVHAWIDCQRVSHGLDPVQEHWLTIAKDKIQTHHHSPDDPITAALVDIRQMLDEVPSKRPQSKELWQRFQDISLIRCRDCDPRRSDIWKPLAKQQRDSKTDLIKRQSLHSIEEENLTDREQFLNGDIDTAMLSTPNQSLRASFRGSSPSTKQQKFSGHGHDHAKTKAELELPTLKMNGDALEESTRAARSPSPRLRTVPKTETVPEETNPKIAQPSSSTSPADIIHAVSTDVGRYRSDNVGPTRSPQLSRSQPTKVEASNRRVIRQDQQWREPKQRQATREANPALRLNENTPHPSTRIIVYDVSKTKVFDTNFAYLNGAYISCS